MALELLRKLSNLLLLNNLFSARVTKVSLVRIYLVMIHFLVMCPKDGVRVHLVCLTTRIKSQQCKHQRRFRTLAFSNQRRNNLHQLSTKNLNWPKSSLSQSMSQSLSKISDKLLINLQFRQNLNNLNSDLQEKVFHRDLKIFHQKK